MSQLDHECKCHNLNEEEKYALLTRIINEYEKNESNLIQILHMAQTIFGFLPYETQKFIAEQMDLPVSKVSGVVTFYSFFSTEPKGQYTIKVCLGTACYVRGGKKILEKLKENLGIDVGETTKDLKFSLEVMRCLGACGLSPVISINGKIYKRVNANKIQQILKTY
ncbi:complex I 24 kDa subunit family protein [Sinanaerobacter chloroacetimidivorans]|uniref:NAD(P)H-dependent oxidoreductase subunit E n=1 Tax=Sinanaerobacter chloroacetimidivorans TaxID=2818044 RepID=A0A8J8B2I4_9FIRM|nr:NAD(P)H-dependent oxidoreductase subunit E [Sinanaerobacter chloroacetimidivorans]MBR0599334.1 NAD(P)H-dependent oxidoreductase subunit E [Sinanaerobacter chloroacetimidivorans]